MYYVEVAGVLNFPSVKMPMYLRAADCFVLPNLGTEDPSGFYTSRLKMFEYMASGMPIKLGDLPSIREVLSDGTSLFFTPDNPESRVNTINIVSSKFSEAEKKWTRSIELVGRYSWCHRADTILQFSSS